MKFVTILALVAAATIVSADTNAQRFARGLPPKAPGRRATPASNARRSSPSGTSNQCNTGSLQCCKSVSKIGDDDQTIDKLTSAGVSDFSTSTLVGHNCSPITAVGTGGNTCHQQAACCTGNNYKGLVTLGCTPTTINL